MSGPDPAVELRGVSKTYFGGVPTPVLFDINLRVMPGEFVAVVGASGSGKTTLLNIVGLLDSTTEGEVWLGGRNVAHLTELERAMLRRDYLGFIFQFHYLLAEFSVIENALMPCRLRGKQFCDARQEAMEDLLRRVGLGDRIQYRPRQLSGGQQQRVAIIRALANDPVVILADEPTGNLDSANGRAVFDLMRELNRLTGKAFLIVTHDESLAREAERVIHIRDGRIE
ncbi:MAG: ABC transporter ATP-binding protein [Acidobacteriota bacterium]|jgi:ABC-type lipoprotein export system ATPase subunit